LGRRDRLLAIQFLDPLRVQRILVVRVFQMGTQRMNDIQQQTNRDTLLEYTVNLSFVKRKKFHIRRSIGARAMRTMIQYRHFTKGIARSAFPDYLTVNRQIDHAVQNDEQVASKLPFMENRIARTKLKFAAELENI
jgi:hypothetical protein